MLSWLLILAAFAAGLLLQHASHAAQLRELLWFANFSAIIPVLVFATFLTFTLDQGLMLAVLGAMASSWALVGVSYVYARIVSDDRDEVGALVLGSSFGNTSFIGYPLAALLWGPIGLNYAVVYDQLCFGVPMTSVTPIIARFFGRRPDARQRSVLRAMITNPPIWGLVLGLTLRFAGVQVPFMKPIESAAAAIVGPIGFVMLGLALPLDAVEHEADEVGRAIGSIALRLLGGPLMLFAVGQLLGAHVPAPFYLIAATPTAFHILVLARIYDLRPALVRLQVVGSTVPMLVFAMLFGRLMAP